MHQKLQTHSFGLMQASKSFHSSLPSFGFCNPNKIIFLVVTPKSHVRIISKIIHQYMQTSKCLHGHTPIEQSVEEKQEYSRFYLLSLVRMLYHDHRPSIEEDIHIYKALKQIKAQNNIFESFDVLKAHLVTKLNSTQRPLRNCCHALCSSVNGVSFLFSTMGIYAGTTEFAHSARVPCTLSSSDFRVAEIK